MDTAAALARMAGLLRPGGVLAVAGLAHSRHPVDFPRDAAAVAADRFWKLRRSYRESSAPVIRPPVETHGEVRAIALRTLPGACFRRRLLWRWTVTWTKPAG